VFRVLSLHSTVFVPVKRPDFLPSRTNDGTEKLIIIYESETDFCGGDSYAGRGNFLVVETTFGNGWRKRDQFQRAQSALLHLLHAPVGA
jgi:hypothetical protein